MDEIKIENIKPTGQRILIEVKEIETKVGGLEIADTATNSAPVTGVVIDVGESSVYKKDQKVLFRRYSVDELKIVTALGEQLLYFLEDSDVLAIIK